MFTILLVKLPIYFFILWQLTNLLSAQSFVVTVSGNISERETGESVIGANVYLKSDPSKGVSSNTYGFYSIRVPRGNQILVISYTGYNTLEIPLNLSGDTIINALITAGITLQEVVVSSRNSTKNVTSNEMGTVEIKAEEVKALPALMGEVDILKALQLMPGISSASEGTAGLYVRGGGADQNLVLLDEAVVYNTGHLLGFFSVFNSDAIKNTRLIKGTMPAEYGSRISSVIDVQMKDGNNEFYEAEGGIGLISSRLTVQGPIKKNNSSFILSGRRTYALDLAQPFIDKTSFAGTNYFFYDFNAKYNQRISSKDRLYVSAYFGRDVFKFSNQDRAFLVTLPYGNSTVTCRWNRILRNDLFVNLSLLYNDYKFSFEAGQEEFGVRVRSGVRDYSAKLDFDYYPLSGHKIKIGGRYTYHVLTPNLVNITDGEVDFQSPLFEKTGHEIESYISDDFRIHERIGVNAGIRFSGFVFTGPYLDPVTQEKSPRGEPVKSYLVPEPRVILNYSLGSQASIKAGFNLTSQNIHLVSNSGTTLPADVWVSSSARIKPQLGYQYTVGFFKNLFDNQLETSVELYYKDLRNQIDYRESYVESFSTDIENEFVFGSGRAYGVELFIQKRRGRWTGWIGYTLSRTERWFDEIENGRVYPAVFDRPHDLSVVQSLQLNKSWQVSATFVYATGRAFTPIQSLFIINGLPNVEYGPRNSSRFDDYHRLDLSLIYKKPASRPKKFTSSWAFSVYNVYNRLNPFFFYTSLNQSVLNGNSEAQAVKVSLFPIIPSITWNFNWASK